MSARKTGALEVECPYCGAVRREPCTRIPRTEGAALTWPVPTAKPHAARVKAAERGEK